MNVARRTILALLLASTAIARAEPTTAPADVAPAVEDFDAAAFPWNGDLGKLTLVQKKAVLALRAVAAQARRAAGLGPGGGRTSATFSTTLPTTAPADLVAAVARLADRDPVARSAARSALMSLDLDALPALRDALANVTITRAQASALRDAVVQVVLASQHGFRGGAGPAVGGALGVSVCAGAGNVPIIVARMPGWDGYRAFEDGDAIVGLRLPVGRGAARRPGDAITPIRTFADLQSAVLSVRPGDRVVARVLRNGVPSEVEVRIARPLVARPDNLMLNPASDEADKYWSTQFAPRLRIAWPTTRAVQ